MTSPLQATPTTTVKVTQYGFFFDQGRCISCQDCMLACMAWNGLPTGAAGRWMRCYTWEEGAFQTLRWYAVSMPCYHCENPVCVDKANGALYKEPKYGAVLLDPAKAKTHSADLRKANDVCPYGAIMFDSNDPVNATASKCTMCIDRLEQGLLPSCVLACDTRAFDFGPLDKMIEKYGNNRQLKGMPDPSIAQPAAVFKAHLPRKNIVPYDANKALDLWQQRGPHAGSDEPLVFANKADVTDPQTALVGKNKLVCKHKSNEELLYYTWSEE
jgi:anaerobic dimethyl sulfoxide reductase subunit B (iron-sulfur subunit)